MAVVTTYIIKKLTAAGDASYYAKNPNTGLHFWDPDQADAFAFTTSLAANTQSDSLESGGGPDEADGLSFTVVQVDTDTEVTTTPGTPAERAGSRRAIADAAFQHVRNVIGMVGDRAELVYAAQNGAGAMTLDDIRRLCDDPRSGFRRVFRFTGNVAVANNIASFVAPYDMILAEVERTVSVAPTGASILMKLQNVTTSADLNDSSTPSTASYKTIQFTRDAIAGDTASLTLGATTLTQAFDTDSQTTYQKLADKLAQVASVGKVIYVNGSRTIHAISQVWDTALAVTAGSVTGATTDAATVATPTCAPFAIAAASTNGGAVTIQAFKVHKVVKGATVRLDVTQIGSGTAGSGLTVTVRGFAANPDA